MARPLGVTIISILQLISGSLHTLVAFGLFASQRPWASVYGLIYLLLGLVLLYLGIGMWNLKKNAWLGTIVAQILVALASLGPSGQTKTGALVISLVTIVYLLSGSVKKSFNN